MTKYTAKDFTRTHKSKNSCYEVWTSNDGLYQIYRDTSSYMYPCGWFYDRLPKTEESGNFWSNLVHQSYDYTFHFDDCLEVLNKVIDGTWLYGKGTLLNQCSSVVKYHGREMVARVCEQNGIVVTV